MKKGYAVIASIILIFASLLLFEIRSSQYNEFVSATLLIFFAVIGALLYHCLLMSLVPNEMTHVIKSMCHLKSAGTQRETQKKSAPVIFIAKKRGSNDPRGNGPTAA